MRWEVSDLYPEVIEDKLTELLDGGLMPFLPERLSPFKLVAKWEVIVALSDPNTSPEFHEQEPVEGFLMPVIDEKDGTFSVYENGYYKGAMVYQNGWTAMFFPYTPLMTYGQELKPEDWPTWEEHKLGLKPGSLRGKLSPQEIFARFDAR